MAMRRVPSWRSLLGGDGIDRLRYLSIYPEMTRKTRPLWVARQHPQANAIGVRCQETWEEVVVAGNTEYERRLAAYEQEVSGLLEQVKTLEEEVVQLRRKLQDAPKRVRTLEERLLETKGQLAQAVSQNEKLSYTLREAREQIADLREEVEKLTQPPSAYGTFLGANDDGTVDVFSGGRKMRVALHPEIELDELERGQEVVLNDSLNVVLARSGELTGEVVTLKEMLDDGLRAL